MPKTEYQELTIRIPKPLHRSARIKSVKTGTSINKLMNEKLAEWVRESEEKYESKPSATASKAGK